MPILEGLDGVQKMSKSLGNYIGIDEPPNEMFGKVMSISDELMWRYFELLSFRPMTQINGYRQEIEAGKNPRDIKFLLAEELVDRFHEVGAGKKAQEEFISRFQKGAMPDEIDEKSVEAKDEGIAIGNLLKEAGLVSSTSEAMRMIKQGAVKIDGEKISDSKLLLAQNSVHIYQVGKRRFAKVTVA